MINFSKIYENLKEWSNMPADKRLNMLVGIIIALLCTVIIYYERKVNARNENNRAAVSELVVRYSAREAALEAKVDMCNANYLQYLQTSEKEYRELLFEAKKLKEQVDENID